MLTIPKPTLSKLDSSKKDGRDGRDERDGRDGRDARDAHSAAGTSTGHAESASQSPPTSATAAAAEKAEAWSDRDARIAAMQIRTQERIAANQRAQDTLSAGTNSSAQNVAAMAVRSEERRGGKECQ